MKNLSGDCKSGSEQVRCRVPEISDEIGTAVTMQPTRNYQRTGNTIIRPLLFKTDIPAFDLARAWYEQFRDDPDPRKRLVFEEDLLDYMRHGFVCVRPHLFALAKVVEHEGERIWFIRIAIGNLLELLQVLPFPLKRLCFCRENQPDSMRIVSVERLAKLIVRQHKKGGIPWAAAA